jgi:outer membrane protein assembly factor BamB
VDGERVVKPNSASIAALVRQTGALKWTADIGSSIPPVAAGDRIFVAAPSELHALSAGTGERLWSAALGGPVRGPMVVRGNLLLALTEPNQLIALNLDTHQIVWRAEVGEGRVLMNADDRAVYLVAPMSRVLCLRLADGSVAWTRTLAGMLSEPALGRDRVFIGSDTASLWALDTRSGDVDWKWIRRIFGGDVIGAAVDDDVIYVASLDNMIRALNRDGSQIEKQDIKTRPVLAPRAFFGTVVVVGLSPTVSTFLQPKLSPVGTWTPPPPTDAQLEGPPLIDEHLKPFGVAMVVILKDGRVVGVRPTAMTFAEPAAAPIRSMPGRPLPRERLPGEPEPTLPVTTTAPSAK